MKMSKELLKKYKDVLNKPFSEFTENDCKKFSKFLEESSKAGLTDEETYES